MLIVTITREEPDRRGRELFRYEAEDLDIPALVRATLDADAGLRRDREERKRVDTAVMAIREHQYCTKDCDRTPVAVVKAALAGRSLPLCSGHIAQATE